MHGATHIKVPSHVQTNVWSIISNKSEAEAGGKSLNSCVIRYAHNTNLDLNLNAGTEIIKYGLCSRHTNWLSLF